MKMECWKGVTVGNHKGCHNYNTGLCSTGGDDPFTACIVSCEISHIKKPKSLKFFRMVRFKVQHWKDGLYYDDVPLDSFENKLKSMGEVAAKIEKQFEFINWKHFDSLVRGRIEELKEQTSESHRTIDRGANLGIRINELERLLGDSADKK